MLQGSLLIIFCVSRAGHVYIYELDSDTLPVSTFAVAGTRLTVSASQPRSGISVQAKSALCSVFSSSARAAAGVHTI